MNCVAQHLTRTSALILSAILATFTALGQNQPVRLNFYGGYTFADKFNFSGYPGYDQAKIDEAGHFGGGLEIEIRPMMGVEIYYQQQPTQGRLLGTSDEFSEDVNVSYLMLGGLRYAGNQRIRGFAGLMAGAAFFNSDDVSSTKFGWGGRLGLLVSPNKKVGIRLGAQVLSAVQGLSGGMYFGTGGAGAGVTTYSTLFQFGLFGGVALTLGDGSQPTPPRPAGQVPMQPTPGGAVPPPPPPAPPK